MPTRRRRSRLRRISGSYSKSRATSEARKREWLDRWASPPCWAWLKPLARKKQKATRDLILFVGGAPSRRCPGIEFDYRREGAPPTKFCRATSHEPRATSHEPRATSHEPRVLKFLILPVRITAFTHHTIQTITVDGVEAVHKAEYYIHYRSDCR